MKMRLKKMNYDLFACSFFEALKRFFRLKRTLLLQQQTFRMEERLLQAASQSKALSKSGSILQKLCPLEKTPFQFGLLDSRLKPISFAIMISIFPGIFTLDEALIDIQITGWDNLTGLSTVRKEKWNRAPYAPLDNCKLLRQKVFTEQGNDLACSSRVTHGVYIKRQREYQDCMTWRSTCIAWYSRHSTSFRHPLSYGEGCL